MTDIEHTACDVVAVGPWAEGEFAAVRAEIDAAGRLPTEPTLDAVADRLDGEGGRQTPPHLVLAAQPRPGTIAQASVERLRRLAPLMRIVVVAGTWCEGELRTGRPLTGVIRLTWYELAAWWRAGGAAVARCESPPWAAPLDDIRSGQLIYRRDARGCAQPSGASRPRRLAAIDAPDFAVFEALSDAIGPEWQGGWRPRHRPAKAQNAGEPRQAAAAGIWDGGQLSEREQTDLAAFCGSLDRAPVIALLDFPRAEHVEIARGAGAAAVMAKPYQAALLVGELARLAVPAAGELPRVLG